MRVVFKVAQPYGSGDRGVHYVPITEKTVDTVPGGDVPVDVVVPWPVPPDFKGHTCLVVEIADYKIDDDPGGVALASDDVWTLNNHAQKNVAQIVPLSNSPYKPTTFDYAVHNAGPSAERAYLEPDGLPYGMTLTVSPPEHEIPPGRTVTFTCTLTLDDRIVDAGCRNDRRFRLTTWRRDPESTVPWGGVEFEVRPRKAVTVSLSGSWDYGGAITLNGTVTPKPGAGAVRLRLAFADRDARWVTVALTSAGTFTWTGTAPSISFSLGAQAVYEGNRQYGPARSTPLALKEPPVVH